MGTNKSPLHPDNDPALAGVKPIDPFDANNTTETRELLYKLFRAEELKDKRADRDQKEQNEEKDKPKIKVWDTHRIDKRDGQKHRIIYEIEINGQKQKFYLTTQVNRRKKTYARLVVLDWNAPFPTERAERGIIYVKQNPETREVVISSDGNERLKTITREQWEAELQKRIQHLDKKQNKLINKNTKELYESVGDPSTFQLRRLEINNNQIKAHYTAQKAKLEQLFTSPDKEILNNSDNHDVVSAVLSMYGNEYIYEDFPSDKSIGSKGATKTAHVSKNKLELIPPREGSPEGTPGSIHVKSHKKDKVVLELKTSQYTGDKLRSAADIERWILLKHPSLAKRFNPKKLSVKRDNDGNILAVYMTVNRAPGLELSRYMNRETRKFHLTTDLRKQITEKLILAVEEDRNKGIIHRDLKPQNVIVDIDEANGIVKSVTIIDYAFADINDRLAGTPSYISPEMYVDPRTADQRTDDYSLGILLREIWNDPVMTDRVTAIRTQTVLHRGSKKVIVRPAYEEEILSAEYALHIPITKTDLRSYEGELKEDYLNNLQQVLDGLTATRPDERMSVSKARKVLGIQPANADEMKASNVEIKAENVAENIDSNFLDAKYGEEKYFDKCFEKLQEIHSEDALLYLLREALDQLADYEISLPESDTQKFLSNCHKEIASTLHGLRQAYLPYVIVFVSEILYKVKNIPDNPNMKHDLDFKKEFIYLKSILYSFNYYEKKIWNDTFLAGMSSQEKANISQHYFIGWNNKREHEKAGVVALGFIFTPLKNIIKVCTEFPLKFMAEMVNYARGKVERTQPSSIIGKGTRLLALGLVFYPLTVVTTGAWLLMRTLTSPKTSLNEAGKAQQSLEKYLDDLEPKNYFTKALKIAGLAVCKLHLLEVSSVLCTAAAIIGVTILAAPAVVYAGAYFSVSSAWIAGVGTTPVFSTIAGLMATPVTWLAAQLGMATTGAALATLTGASALAGFSAIVLGIRAAAVHVYEVHVLNRPPKPKQRVHQKAAVAPAAGSQASQNQSPPQGGTTSQLYRDGIEPKTVDLPGQEHKGSSEMKSGQAISRPLLQEPDASAPPSDSRPRLKSTSRS